jgi:hypothetical protein
MSGGRFNYDQYKISYIADEIEQIVYYNDDKTPSEYGGTKGHGYSLETIAEFEKAIQALRSAFIYAHRVDWLLSGDDGEDDFHKRLKTELEYQK